MGRLTACFASRQEVKCLCLVATVWAPFLRPRGGAYLLLNLNWARRVNEEMEGSLFSTSRGTYALLIGRVLLGPNERVSVTRVVIRSG